MPSERRRKRYSKHITSKRPCVSPPATCGSSGRTLTRSSRQGGLLDALVLGDGPEHTVRRLWSASEDALLRAAIKKIGARQWRVVAAHVPGRSHIQCMQRWHKVLEPSLNKGLWSAAEDGLLRAAVAVHGSSRWPAVAATIPGRNCKQCRERWNNYLDPTLRKGPWEPSEDRALVQARAMFGDRWSMLAKLIPGRSQIQVRDRCRVLRLKAKQAQAEPTPMPSPPASPPHDASASFSAAGASSSGSGSESESECPPSPAGQQFGAVVPAQTVPAPAAVPAAPTAPQPQSKAEMVESAFACVRSAVLESAFSRSVDVEAGRGLLLLCAASYCSPKSPVA